MKTACLQRRLPAPAATVSAGGKSLTIPITVARQALKTVEDFEDTELIFSSGPYLKVSRTHASDYVQRGRYAGKLDYTLSADTEWLSIALGRGFSNLTDHYTALNLWVYGDGSGNQLSFLYTGDTKSDLRLPVTLLDFTGWKQVSVTLPQYFTLSGLEISVPSTTYADDSGITVEYADTPRSGTVCIDQLVGSFPGTVDNTPPVVTGHAGSAELGGGCESLRRRGRRSAPVLHHRGHERRCGAGAGGL